MSLKIKNSEEYNFITESKKNSNPILSKQNNAGRPLIFLNCTLFYFEVINMKSLNL